MKIISSHLYFPLILLLFLIPNIVYALIGDADTYAFDFTTKMGSSVSWSSSDRSIRLGVGGGNYEVFGLKVWYFYRDNIMGTCSCRLNNLTAVNGSDRCHFIGDEKGKKIDIFIDTEKWGKEVKARNLEPIFTRYYTSHYDSTKFWLWLFFLTPLVIFPIGMLILLIVVVGKAITKEKFDRQEPNTRLTIVMLVVVGFMILNFTKNLILGVQSV